MKNIITIGTKVNKIVNGTANYMKNGIVTAIHGERAFVTWPHHGNSSVPLNSIHPA